MLVDTFSNRLQLAMISSKIKQVELCKKTGLDKSLLNKYLSGKVRAKPDKLSSLANALNVNEIWLMGYDAPIKTYTENNVHIPLLDNIKPIPNFLDSKNWIGTISIDFNLSKTGNFFALKITDDSMSPAIITNDIVFIKQQAFCNTGDIALVCIHNCEILIRKIIKNDEGIMLQPFCNNFTPNFFVYQNNHSQIQVLGIVKKLIREF